MTNRMAKVERRTNEAIATIFRQSPHTCSSRQGFTSSRGAGQRLQAKRKDEDPDAQVDILASMNAAEHERDEAANGNDSDDD